MLNHIYTKIQSGRSVIVASSFDQTRPSVLKPDNSHFSDGPLIMLSLQLLLMSITNMYLYSAIFSCCITMLGMADTKM